MSPGAQPTQVIQTEATAPANAMSDVFVPAAQCLAAGVGAGLVAGIVANHLDNAFSDCITWGLTTAGIVCGLALFWRFAWSVAHEDWEWEKLLLTVDNQEDMIQRLTTELHTVSLERDAMRHEAKVQEILRNKANKNYMPAESELDPVRENARKMIDYWLATGSHPSRRKMEDAGISQTDYAAALGYLQIKGALVVNGSQVTWKVNTIAQGELVLS